MNGWPRRLILVRHAESIGNTLTSDERAAYEVSTHSYMLTERGRWQAQCTGKYLRDKFPVPEVFYTSYYTRAKQTLEEMFPGVRYYEDPRLAEAQRGIFHVLTKAQIEQQLPFELIRKEREGLYHFRPIGGENWPDIELRIHSFLGTLARDCSGKEVLMVVHGNWLILFQRLIHHFSIDEAVAIYHSAKFENASVTIYEREGEHLSLKHENIVPWR